MKISKAARQDIIDAIAVEKIDWSGRLEETAFLRRIFDLSAMPSTDGRFSDAEGDIWQHRINNPFDWEDDWVFHDNRFNLMDCDDEVFLRFLCEMIHPAVRSDATESSRICQLFNSFLVHDGFEIVQKTSMAGRPVYVGRSIVALAPPYLSTAKKVWQGIDASYVTQQITRMEAAVRDDPDLAIGTAKELLETCCKTILHECGQNEPKNPDLPQLVKLTAKELRLTPDDIPEASKAAQTIKRLLSNLATVAQGIAELRNQYGTGHGKHAQAKGLSSRHAKLAVGAASTLAVFLFETHQARKK